MKSISHNINFIIVADKFRYEWDAVYPTPKRKDWFISQLKEIGELIIPNTKVSIIKDFSEIDFDLDVSYTPFLSEIKARNDHYVFKYIMLMTEIQFMRVPSDDLLMLSSDFKGLLNLEGYICWHIRGSSVHSSEEDETPADILKYYNLISSEVSLPIVVISSVGALPYLKSILGKKTNAIFSKDTFDSFLSDAKLILGSSLYVQCGWGGTFNLPIFSNTPYLGPPIERVHAPWERLKPHVRDHSKIRPWASSDQQTFSNAADFKLKLRELSKRLDL